MRKIELNHDKLHQLLSKKDGFIKEGRGLTKQIEDLDKERHKIGLKVEKLKGKVAQYLDKENIQLEEFEYIQALDIKDDKVEVTIMDAIEEYKTAYRDRKSAQQ